MASQESRQYNPLRNARFLLGAARPAQFPAPAPEVAFAGRSNAGKSSALNRLCERRNLARTGKAPGRTQQINFFELDGGQRLADLPGYGYARVPERVRQGWARLIESYFKDRPGLAGVILIMDARHPLKPFDRDMLEYADALELPLHVLLTKADKLKRGEQKQALATVSAELGALASAQLFSATSGLGATEARAIISEWLGIELRELRT